MYRPFFWTRRSYRDRLTRLVYRQLLDVRQGTRGAGGVIASLALLARSVHLDLAFSMSIALVVVLIDSLVLPDANEALRSAASLPTREQWITILGTTLQTAGLLIGLYLTAVSIVIGTVYSGVTTSVLRLILHERVNNAYLHSTACLGALSVELLVALSLGYKLGIVAGVVTSALSIFCVLGIIVLALRTFFFFDPTSVLYDIAHSFGEAVKGAAGGLGWTNAAVQLYYRQTAASYLDAFAELLRLAAAKPHLRNTSLVEAISLLQTMYRDYGLQKSLIPTSSYWFERKYEHQDWLLAQGSQVEMALSTGTALSTRAVPDHLWVEETILPLLTEAMLATTDGRDHLAVYEVTERLQAILQELLEHGAIRETWLLHETLNRLVLSVGRTISEFQRTSRTDSLMGRVEGIEHAKGAFAIVDIGGLSLVSTCLGTMNAVRANSAQAVATLLDGITWGDSRSLYSLGLSRAVIERIEFLDDYLVREALAEGTQVTPRWFVERLLAEMQYAASVDMLTCLVDSGVTGAVHAIDELIKNDEPLLAASFIHRSIEAISKGEFHLNAAVESLEGLRRLRREGDPAWVTFDENLYRRQLSDFRHSIVARLALVGTNLLAGNGSPELPDFLGQSYATLCESLYDALLHEADPNLSALASAVFELSTGQTMRLMRPTSTGQVAFETATDPLVDLMELSGHAIILSELRGVPHSELIFGLWDGWFSSRQLPERAAEFVLAVANERASDLPMTARSRRRFAWKSRTERELIASGYQRNLFFGVPMPTPVGSRLDQPSAVLRALARSGLTVTDARDVFCAVYMANMEQGRHSDRLSRSAEALRARIREEEA